LARSSTLNRRNSGHYGEGKNELIPTEDMIQALNEEIMTIGRVNTDEHPTVALLKDVKNCLIKLQNRALLAVEHVGTANYSERQREARRYVLGEIDSLGDQDARLR